MAPYHKQDDAFYDEGIETPAALTQMARDGVQAVQDWQTSEIHQLRDDIEDATTARELAEAEIDDALDIAEKWEHKYKTETATAIRKADEQNHKLRDKVCIFVDLFEEYEKMLDIYVHRTGVKLTTTNLKKILELKQKGDLIP